MLKFIHLPNSICIVALKFLYNSLKEEFKLESTGWHTSLGQYCFHKGDYKKVAIFFIEIGYFFLMDADGGFLKRLFHWDHCV